MRERVWRRRGQILIVEHPAAERREYKSAGDVDQVMLIGEHR